MSRVSELGQGLLRCLFRADPVEASSAGFHEFDGLLPFVDPDAIGEHLAEVSQYISKFEKTLQDGSLPLSDKIDAEVVVSQMRAKIAKEASLPEWRTNPCWYLSAVSQGLHVLITGDYGSPSERAESLASRLESVPAFLTQAERNLDSQRVPQDWLDISLQMVKGTGAMVTDSALAFLKSCGSRSHGTYESLCEKAFGAIRAFGGYLAGLKTVAHGEFASGREYFEEVLRNVHMVDMDANALKEFGLDKVSEYEAALAKAAREIDSSKNWTELLAEFKRDHPTADRVLDAYRDEVSSATEFVRKKDLISMPSGQECLVLPTPEFSRATSPMGHMRTSPPFEDGLQSVLYITPIDLKATPERQLQHLEDNCYAFIRSIAFHEVIPGHHLQACLHKLTPSDIRKKFRTSVFTEGWGLYTEVLMAEQGYLDAPATRLLNLKNALWRAVRVLVDVGLHVEGMSVEEATKILQDKVRMEHHMASGEVKRYTMSPTYQSSYILGKEQILRLRKDYASRMGSRYSLKKFHDELLSHGSIPVALVRKEMLG